VTEAKTRHALKTQTELFLLEVGPLLRTRPALFNRAAALYASTVAQEPCAVSVEASERYRAELALYSGPETESRKLPKEAVGKFPFDKPTLLLCERIHEIEALLAPLSERRTKAHALSLRLVGSRGSHKPR